jgi:pimeloyl-ACP methyl ester carboxylesterase
MDVSASFQFLVDAFQRDWYCVAPDWRGFGETAWSGIDCYWFPDYYADLDALIDHFSPQAPINLLGHSMGGNVACIYAGVRPARIARLINAEGFGMSETVADHAPERLDRWLKELREAQEFREYASFAALAERLQKNNARLSLERAQFLARFWGRETNDGRVALRSDPAHKRVNPALYRLEEAQACWRNISAPVLWIEGAQTETLKGIKLQRAEVDQRKKTFGRLREVVIPDCGHMIHHDQPELFACAIEAFLLDGSIPSGEARPAAC